MFKLYLVRVCSYARTAGAGQHWCPPGLVQYGWGHWPPPGTVQPAGDTEDTEQTAEAGEEEAGEPGDTAHNFETVDIVQCRSSEPPTSDGDSEDDDEAGDGNTENADSKSETELIVTLCESPHRWCLLSGGRGQPSNQI